MYYDDIEKLKRGNDDDIKYLEGKYSNNFDYCIKCKFILINNTSGVWYNLKLDTSGTNEEYELITCYDCEDSFCKDCYNEWVEFDFGIYCKKCIQH